MEYLVLLGLLLVLGYIMGIVGFFRATSARAEIRALHAKIAELTASQTAGGQNTAIPGAEAAPFQTPAPETFEPRLETADAILGSPTPESTTPESPAPPRDLESLLTGTGDLQRDAYFFYRGAQLFAVRMGKWKAHFFTQPGYGAPKPEPHDPPLLFDLQSDPGESFHVAAHHPDVVTQLVAAVERHRANLQPAPTQLEAVVADPPKN